jgi:catechol-2,3-dioxygenase
MQITELQLHTQHVKAQRVFYGTTLGLPLLEATIDSFTVQAGTTRLTFQATTQQGVFYHFAFTIPANKQAQAKDWLWPKVSLLTWNGQEEVFFENWNAHALYFYDEAGNIVEFIAHHDLPNARPGSFVADDVLYVSEIGMVVNDVPAQVDAFKMRLGIEPYKGESSELFRAVGDIYGRFITVKVGRPWFPTTTRAAVVAPVSVTIHGTQPQHYHVSPFPYVINVTAAPPPRWPLTGV